MVHRIVLLCVLAVLWLAWSGHFEPLMLGLGALSLLAVVGLCARLRIVDEESVPLGIHYGRLLLYIPWLALEVVKANLDVARRVVTPGRLAIDPVLVRVRTSQRTDVGRVIHANSITLTPGTVSVDVRDDEILVHALHAQAAAGVQSGEMDARVRALERGAG